MIHSRRSYPTKDSEEILDSKQSAGLREQVKKNTTDHIHSELAPVLEAIKQNQVELQSCVRQMKHLLDLQQAPWRKAGPMLWGIVMGVFLFALLQSQIKYSSQACSIGNKIVTTWSSLSDTERHLIEKIVGE